jgi:hypothetical protein
MSNPAFRFARVSGQSIDWMLKRNCSVTPSQLGWAYGALCVTSLGIGAWFWAMGARFVLGFAWIELMAVGLAFFAYARHAGDGETISLRGVNDLPGGPAVNQLNLPRRPPRSPKSSIGCTG